MIVELVSLYCAECPLLIGIPVIEGLQRLNCSNCPLLTTIPQITALQKLNCSNCRLIIKLPQVTKSIDLNKSGCVWENDDINYKQSIDKLIFLQRWLKKIILSKRLTILIPQLIPLYHIL